MKFVCHSEPTFGGGDFWRRKFAEFHSIKFVADSVLFFWGGPLGQKSWEVLQEKIVSSLQHETCIRFTSQEFTPITPPCSDFGKNEGGAVIGVNTCDAFFVSFFDSFCL